MGVARLCHDMRMQRCAFQVCAFPALPICLLLSATVAFAQPGAKGPVADLNAEAKAAIDASPERALAAAQQALTLAQRERDLRGQAEALNYIAAAHRSQSLLDKVEEATTELINEQLERACAIVHAERDSIARLVEMLMERDTLDADEIASCFPRQRVAA